MANGNNKTSLDDIKDMRNYILGVVAFATAIATFLINCVPTTPKEFVFVSVAGVAAAMVVIGLLITRSEKRQAKALAEHKCMSGEQVKSMNDSIKKIEALAIENQRSSLRTEMHLSIHHSPQDHPTILKMAERYFMELKGDWVETDLFLTWVENERKAGRPVNVPPQLANTVNELKIVEDAKSRTI